MDALTLAMAAAFVVLCVGFSVLFARLTARGPKAALTADVDVPFSPERYKVMERLLDEHDCRMFFERTHSRAMERQFRLRRIRIFREYLRQLSADFRRVTGAVKLVMVGAPVDRLDLAHVLMKQQITFAAGMVSVEYRLFLYRHDWGGVNTARLTESVRQLRDQLQSVTALAQPAAA